MDDRKARLVILGAAGLLLAGGVIAWTLHIQSPQVANNVEPPVRAKEGLPAGPLAPKPPHTVANVQAAPETIPVRVRATTHEEAAAAAKASIGRLDPMQPIAGAAASARHIATVPSRQQIPIIPPPPPGVPAIPTSQIGALPEVPVAGPQIDELPPPPEKPLIAKDLDVISMMDGGVIVKLPSALRIKNHWPASVTLHTGEEYKGITLVAVSPEGATFAEDGEKLFRPMSGIR